MLYCWENFPGDNDFPYGPDLAIRRASRGASRLRVLLTNDFVRAPAKISIELQAYAVYPVIDGTSDSGCCGGANECNQGEK